jgi:hypothetical protein
MPTYSINSIAQYKKYVGVSFTSTTEQGLPNFESADRKYLLPILGQTVYNALTGQIESGTITWATLLDIVRSYVAPMATLDTLATKHIKLTDSGVKKTTGDTLDNVFRWEFEKLEDALKKDAAQALDDLWKHLIDNKATYTWTNPITTKSPIKTGADFKAVYPVVHHVYRIFPMLIAIMETVMDQHILPSIGEGFYGALESKTNPGDDEKAAMVLIKKAVAHYTIMESCTFLPARITHEGFTVLIGGNELASQGQQHAPDSTLSALRNSCELKASGYMKLLLDLLNSKATDELFSEFKSSDLYKDPNAITTSPNKDRKGLFGM